MSDVELVREILRQVLDAARTIAKRFAPISAAEVCAHHIQTLEQTIESILQDSSMS